MSLTLIFNWQEQFLVFWCIWDRRCETYIWERVMLRGDEVRWCMLLCCFLFHWGDLVITKSPPCRHWLNGFTKVTSKGSYFTCCPKPQHPSRGCLEFFSQMFLCLYLEMSSDQISSSDLHTNFLHVFVQPFSCVFGLNYFLQTWRDASVYAF